MTALPGLALDPNAVGTTLAVLTGLATWWAICVGAGLAMLRVIDARRRVAAPAA